MPPQGGLELAHCQKMAAVQEGPLRTLVLFLKKGVVQQERAPQTLVLFLKKAVVQQAEENLTRRRSPMMVGAKQGELDSIHY